MVLSHFMLIFVAKSVHWYITSMMEQRKFTFDNVVRGLLSVAVIVGIVMLLNRLSSVLLPFFVAWLLAYLLFPMVKFFQFKCRLRFRIVGILCTFLTVALVLTGIVWLVVPPMIDESIQLKDAIINYIEGNTTLSSVPGHIQQWIRQQFDVNELKSMVTQEGFLEKVKEAMPKVWDIIMQSFSVLSSLISLTMILLYTLFILLDYEYLTSNWIKIFPKKNRPFWQGVATDVERAMNSYMRGQGLVALIMGILFCIGFTIIDFPMAIGLGILIGIMDLVPYLHSLALIPTVFLALLKAADTGQNFWIILASAVAVFLVVQAIIDFIVTPKIMGKAMGLNPAILLLSLSVWGALLGFIGLIIALPLTTLIIAYYKRYVTKDEEKVE